MLGVLIAPIQRENRGAFRFLTSRCILYGEPLVINNDINVQVSLIEYLNKIIRPKVILTQYRFLTPPKSELFKYFEMAGYLYEPYLNIINNTSLDIADLWKGIERRRKQNIK